MKLTHFQWLLGITLATSVFLLPSSSLGEASKAKPTNSKNPVSLNATWTEIEPDAPNPSKIVFQSEFPEKEWWLQYHDNYLTDYIHQALFANQEIAIATARLAEARALAQAAFATEFPTITLGGNYTRQRNSATLVAPSAQQIQGGGGFFPGRAINFYNVPLQTSYELDFLGKKWDRVKAARSELKATEQDRQAATLMISTNVASAYFNWVAVEQLITLQNQYIQVSQDDLTYTNNLYQEGLVSEESVVIKQGLLTDARAALQDFFRLQALYRNQLSLLMGKTPKEGEHLAHATWEQFELPQQVAAGVPSTLLVHRPDIQSAEARLQSAGFNVKAARKVLFPTITLNGQFGYTTTRLNQLFRWDSHVLTAGAGIMQTVFDAGSLRANLKRNQALYDQQLHRYQQILLTAFGEVENSLASLKSHINAYDEYQASLNSLNKRVEYAQIRLQEGAIAAGELNPTLVQVSLSQEGLVKAKLAAINDSISLYKALGGGF